MIFLGIPYLLSQWIWPLILKEGLIISEWPQFSPHQDIYIQSRKPNLKWNKTSLPIIYTHDTDVHINIANENSHLAFQKILQTVKYYDPTVHFLTGDLSDSYTKLDYPRYSDQEEESWKIYNSILKNESEKASYRVIECAGNHDMWGIKSKQSDSFNLLKYSLTYSNVTDEANHKYMFDDVLVIKDIVENRPFIIVNPFRFPTGHSTLLFYPVPLKDTLDHIEAAVNENNNSIFVCHYPLDMWKKVKNSNGKTIRDIVMSTNIKLIITGHSHPSFPKVRHHGNKVGILEMTGVGGMEHDIFGLITEDNDRFVYHAIYVNAPTKGLITYPVPLNQTNYHTNYDDENAEVRVLYAGKSANISVSGDVECERMNEIGQVNSNFYLYSCPLKVKEEKFNCQYHIEFKGDFIDSLDFMHGNASYVFLQETERSSPHNVYCEIHFTIALFIIFQLICFPVNIFNFKNLEDWIEGIGYEDKLKSCSILNLITCILFGFVSVRSRILKAPLFVRIVLYIAALWPIGLPSALMEIDGVLGFVFSYGYYCEGYAFSTDGPRYTLLYLWNVVFPFIILVSSISTQQFLFYTFYIDLVLVCYCLGYGIYDTIINNLSETVGFLFMSISFAYTIIPFILLITIIIWMVLIFKKKYNPTNVISFEPLLTKE